jgi:hypothetical protein
VPIAYTEPEPSSLADSYQFSHPSNHVALTVYHKVDNIGLGLRPENILEPTVTVSREGVTAGNLWLQSPLSHQYRWRPKGSG